MTQNAYCLAWPVLRPRGAANVFSELPNSEKSGGQRRRASTLLWFEHPAERFLLVTDVATANMLTEKLHGEAELVTSQQWLALILKQAFR